MSDYVLFFLVFFLVLFCGFAFLFNLSKFNE